MSIDFIDFMTLIIIVRLLWQEELLFLLYFLLNDLLQILFFGRVSFVVKL